MATEHRPILLDDAGDLVIEAACRSCGYDLRGLSTTGRCPGCGEAVEASLRSELLCFADVSWLRRLRMGLWTLIASVGLVVAAFALTLLSAFFGYPRLFFSLMSPAVVTMTELALYVGIAIFNAPDPSGTGELKQMRLRLAMRVAVYAGIIDASWSLLRHYALGISVPASMTWPLSFASALACLAGVYALLISLGHLAARLPNDEIARRAQITATSIAASVGTLTVFGLIARVMSLTGLFAFAFAIASTVCLLIAFVNTLQTIVFVVRVQQQLTEQIAFASSTRSAQKVTSHAG